MTISTLKWTIEHYHQAIEAGLFDDMRVELLDGELIEMPPEGPPHAGFTDSSSRYIQRLVEERAIVRVGHPITLLNNSEPEPDLAIVQPFEELYRTERHPYPENVFWLIEYSESSLEKDLKVKTRIYAEANIAEYWVINLRRRELIVFRDPVDGEYQSRSTLTSGMIRPLAFPDVEIEVARLIR